MDSPPQQNEISAVRRGKSFSIASLLIVTTIIAILIRWPLSGYYFTSIIPAAILYAFCRNDFARLRYLAILVAVYLPASQGFFYEGSHCRKMWPQLFPVASGFAPAVLLHLNLGFNRYPFWIELLEASILVMLVILIAYFLAGINRLAWIATLLFVASLSTFASYVLVGLLHV